MVRGAAETVETYARALNDQDAGVLRGLVHPDVVGHEQAGDVVGLEAFVANIESWFSSYPDLRLTTEDMFEQGDRAAWRWTLRGTHAPTGKPVVVAGIIVFRVERGQIAEYWGHYDRLGLLEQQGSGSPAR